MEPHFALQLLLIKKFLLPVYMYTHVHVHVYNKLGAPTTLSLHTVIVISLTTVYIVSEVYCTSNVLHVHVHVQHCTSVLCYHIHVHVHVHVQM